MRRYLGNLKYTFVSLQRLKYRMIFVVVNFISNFSSKINGVFVVAQIVFELCAENWWIVSCSLHCHLMAFPKHGELCCPNQSTKHIWTLSSICSSRFLLAMGPYAVCAACCVPVQTWWPGMSVEGAGQGWAQPHSAPPSPALPANLCWGGGHCLHDGDGLAKLASPSMLWIRTYERKGRSNSFPCSPGV